MESRKSLNNLRDCVKKAFEEGSERGYEFNKMRFAIIVELKRLGFTSSEVKDKLLEWNQRCKKVLLLNEQKRQLFDFADWTDKRDCKIGCRALEDFCIGQDKCSFLRNKLYVNRKVVEILPFDFEEARRFLEEQHKAEGYLMALVLKNLRRYQIEKGTGEIIFIGYRAIATLIREHDGHIIDPMTVCRRMHDLVSEGMIEIVSKGSNGTFNKPANGYKFLSWKQTHNNPK